MEAATGYITDPRVEHVITRRDPGSRDALRSARYRRLVWLRTHDGAGRVSPRRSHRHQGTDTTGDCQFASEPVPAPLSKDLDQLLEVAEGFAVTPPGCVWSLLAADLDFWREFDLPSTERLSFLHSARRFHLAPLMRALQSLAPYCVAIIESGKAGFL